MTVKNYAITDLNDLLSQANDIVVFMRTGVIADLDESSIVEYQLLSRLDDVISKASLISVMIMDKK